MGEIAEADKNATNRYVNDLVTEAERWDDVSTLILSSNTVVIKNLYNSGFARMVSGYLGDTDATVQEQRDGDSLRVVIS